jgi:hypothetical protein
MVIGEAGCVLLGMTTEVDGEASTGAVSGLAWFLPYSFEVLEWGVVVSEDFDAHTVDPAIKLEYLDKAGGTAVTVGTLTIGNSNTNLYKGDGVKEVQTVISADTDIDNGHVIFGPRSSVPKFVNHVGTELRFNVSAQGTVGTAGKYYPFVIIKPMLDARSAKAWIDVG